MTGTLKTDAWKYIGKATGQNHIDLPSNWNELYITMRPAGNQERWMEATIVSWLAMSGQERRMVVGWYTGTNTNQAATIVFTTSYVYLNNHIVNGTNQITTSEMFVFWR